MGAPKDRQAELTPFVRELEGLRRHNQQARKGEGSIGPLLLAEATFCLLTLERLLRAVLGAEASDRETVYKLLEKATVEETGPLVLPTAKRSLAIAQVSRVKDGLSRRDESDDGDLAARLAPDVEALSQLIDHLFQQLGPSGETRPSARRAAAR